MFRRWVVSSAVRAAQRSDELVSHVKPAAIGERYSPPTAAMRRSKSSMSCSYSANAVTSFQRRERRGEPGAQAADVRWRCTAGDAGVEAARVARRPTLRFAGEAAFDAEQAAIATVAARVVFGVERFADQVGA